MAMVNKWLIRLAIRFMLYFQIHLTYPLYKFNINNTFLYPEFFRLADQNKHLTIKIKHQNDMYKQEPDSGQRQCRKPWPECKSIRRKPHSQKEPD